MSASFRCWLAVLPLCAGLSAAAGADDAPPTFNQSLPNLDFHKSDHADQHAVVVTWEEEAPTPLVQAQTYRAQALESADIRLAALAVQVENGEPLDAYGPETTGPIASWLNVKPNKPKDDAYLAVLRDADRVVKENILVAPVIVVPPESDAFCAQTTKDLGPIYAYHRAGSVYVCRSWYQASFPCRRVVLIHETFHVANLVDVDAKIKFPARTTAQALRDAAYMAGLVSQLHSQHEDSCP